MYQKHRQLAVFLVGDVICLIYLYQLVVNILISMKTMKCDLCDHEAQGETFEGWMEALKPHYMEAHVDVMSSKQGTPEEMKAEMEKWMQENKARFDSIE